MSQDSEALKNKQQKVHFQQYLANSDEPQDDASRSLPLLFQAELAGNSSAMRNQFRDLAASIRNQDAHQHKSFSTASNDDTGERVRLKNHAEEMQRIDELELSALHSRVERLKQRFNAKRRQQGLKPLL